MQPTQQDFAETYRALPDEDLAALSADIGSLTEEARSALLAEIQQRGLSEAQIQKLHADEHRHEAQFDRLEKFRRKKLAWGDLPTTRGQWIFAGVAVLALIVWSLISDLVSRHH